VAVWSVCGSLSAAEGAGKLSLQIKREEANRALSWAGNIDLPPCEEK
jgi:hypothetical protein